MAIVLHRRTCGCRRGVETSSEHCMYDMHHSKLQERQMGEALCVSLRQATVAAHACIHHHFRCVRKEQSYGFGAVHLSCMRVVQGSTLACQNGRPTSVACCSQLGKQHPPLVDCWQEYMVVCRCGGVQVAFYNEQHCLNVEDVMAVGRLGCGELDSKYLVNCRVVGFQAGSHAGHIFWRSAEQLCRCCADLQLWIHVWSCSVLSCSQLTLLPGAGPSLIPSQGGTMMGW